MLVTLPSAGDLQLVDAGGGGDRGGGEGGGRKERVLVTLPSAGHLQLLDKRENLPFAEMCGVGKEVEEEEVGRLVGCVVAAACRVWVTGVGGGGVRKVVEEEARREGVEDRVVRSLVWEGGGGEGGESGVVNE